MNKDMSYNAVLARKNEIMKKAIGIDYSKFESDMISFDYEKMMKETGYTLEEMRRIQFDFAVGHTALLEMKNLTN